MLPLSFVQLSTSAANACSCFTTIGLMATFPSAPVDDLPVNTRFVSVYTGVPLQDIPTTLWVDGVEVPVVVEVLYEEAGVITIAVTPESTFPAGSVVEFGDGVYGIGDGFEALAVPDDLRIASLNRRKRTSGWGGGGDCSPWDFVELSFDGLADDSETYLEVELEQGDEVSVVAFFAPGRYVSVGEVPCGGNAPLAPNEGACVRVRQVDPAGNASAWSESKCVGRGCACSSGRQGLFAQSGLALFALQIILCRRMQGVSKRRARDR